MAMIMKNDKVQIGEVSNGIIFKPISLKICQMVLKFGYVEADMNEHRD
jgi:hypothetical protein